MSAELLDWLLECPMVEGVSQLSADAHACGLLDIRLCLGNAIAVAVKARLAGVTMTRQSPSYHEVVAGMHATRRVGLRMRVDRGVGLLCGTLAPGVGLSETGRNTVLHLRTAVPDTITMAMTGRDVTEVIASPLFRTGRYKIVSAKPSRMGVEIWLRGPPAIVPVHDLG